MITINGKINETKKPILKVIHTQLNPHYWNKTRTRSMWWLDIVKIPYKMAIYPIFLIINRFPGFYEKHFYGVFPIAEVKWTLIKEANTSHPIHVQR